VKPIEIEIVVPTLTTLEVGCRKCTILFAESGIVGDHQSSSCDEYPEEWKADLQRICDWIVKISTLYKHRIRVRIIDAHSLLGIWKQIRHRLSGTPGFIVDGVRVCSGWDTDRVETIIDEQIGEASLRLRSHSAPRAVPTADWQ
jgi:hypothetical protein